MTTQAMGTHSVVFDHTDCTHAAEDDDADHVCAPTATWTCNAPPGDYCVFGCEEAPCYETGWNKSDDNPTQCSYGHALTTHECWVLSWLRNGDLEASHARGENLPYRFVYHDGPIDVVDWDEDYLLWDYPA